MKRLICGRHLETPPSCHPQSRTHASRQQSALCRNQSGRRQSLYETVYCARGEMENRIKEQQLDLFADRTSCSLRWPNQFRLLLSTQAYTLIQAIRRITLTNTELAQATCATIRLKLFKIGAVIIRNTRRIRLLLSSQYPFQSLFQSVYQRLCPD